MTISFRALDAVETLIAELVRDYGWKHQYATDIVDRVVFLPIKTQRVYGVQVLIDRYGAQAVEEAVRRLR